jgi:hypothetical protein
MSVPETTPRQSRTKWRPEWTEEMLRDWPRGVSQQEFSRRFGVAPAAIYNHAKKLGLLPHLGRKT